jgi:hypothetical protein
VLARQRWREDIAGAINYARTIPKASEPRVLAVLWPPDDGWSINDRDVTADDLKVANKELRAALTSLIDALDYSTVDFRTNQIVTKARKLLE